MRLLGLGSMNSGVLFEVYSHVNVTYEQMKEGTKSQSTMTA